MPEKAFIGLEYRIPVNLNGNVSEDVTVKVSYGNVYRRDDSTFAFSPMEGFNEVKVKLYYRNLICDMKNVEVKRIPDYGLVLGGESQGSIGRQKFLTDGRLRYEYGDDIPEEMRSRIYTYNLMLREPSGISVYSGQVRGDKPDKAALDFIAKVPAGTVMVINNITAITPGNALTRLSITKELVITD